MAYSKQNFQNGQILNATNLEKMENGIIAGQGAHNLLDNSDFTNAVNQRGATTATLGKYFIDRWGTEPFPSGPSITIDSNGITLLPTTSSTAGIFQQIPDYEKRKGKIHTFAICVGNEWKCVPFTMGNFGVGYQIHGLYFFSVDNRNILIRNNTSDNPAPITIQRVALYEGSYDANTLPAYVPKGKHVEMLNCGVSLAPHNLLDNSDFTNPVNQRGQTSYTGTGGKVYTIDRWHTWSASISVSVQSGYLSVTNSTDSLYQNIAQIIDKHNLTGKAATIAVWDANGNAYCASGVISKNNEIVCDTPTDFWFSAILEDDNTIYFAIRPRGAKTANIKAAALYEGSYDASTLPAYQPKGYAAELAECQRYYENSWFGVGKTNTQEYIANVWSTGQADARIEFKQPKRISPTITFYPIGTESNWKIFNNGYQIVDSVENKGRGGLSGFIARVSKGSSDGTTWTVGYTIQAQGHWEASADL